jgi:hypothetical protein
MIQIDSICTREQSTYQPINLYVFNFVTLQKINNPDIIYKKQKKKKVK